MKKTKEKTYLTHSEATLLHALLDYTEQNGIPPTVEELAEYSEYSKSRVSTLLRALDDKGAIKRRSGWRQTRVTEGGTKLLGEYDGA